MQNQPRRKHLPAIAAALAVASLALAGCFGDDGNPQSSDTVTTTTSGQPTPGGNGNNTPLPIANRADLLDCKTLVAGHFVDRSRVSDHLPEGFAATSPIPGVANVVLEYFDCRAMVASNQTLHDEVTMALVYTLVSVPSEYHTSGVSDFFVFEWFADPGGLLDFLRGHGASAKEGRVFVDPELPESRLEVDGEVLYRTGPVDKAESDPDPLFQLKFHFLTPSGVSSAFFNMTLVEEDSRPSGAITTVAGGVLSDFATSPVNRIPAVSGHGVYSGYLDVKST